MRRDESLSLNTNLVPSPKGMNRTVGPQVGDEDGGVGCKRDGSPEFKT
jgi:hypothetical protein